MPLHQELLEEMAHRRETAEREAQRAVRREMLRAGLLCVAWMLLGLYLLGWSVHTTDEQYGRMAFYGGLVVGNGGILYTLLSSYRRIEKRGDL